MTMKLKPTIIAALTFAFAGFLAFAGTAMAASAATPSDGSLLDLAKPVYDQVMAGHYLAAVCLALIVAVAAIRRYAPDPIGAFMHTDAGGAAGTFATALLGALATATMAGAVWHWSMLWAAMGIAVAAAGGYTMLKKLVVDPLLASKWYQDKAPAWLKAGAGLVLWVFTKRDDGAAVIADAEKAGEAAVAAKPGEGLGVPKEIP